MPYDTGRGGPGSSLNARVAAILSGQPLNVKQITSGIGNIIKLPLAQPGEMNLSTAPATPDMAFGTISPANIGSIFPPQQHAGTLARQAPNTLASLGLAPTPATNTGAGGGAGGPMTYEQALAMAQKMMGEAGVGGGADMAPINAAIKAAQNTAANASKQAKGNSARTQSDLAVLYGRLGNYVKGLLTAEHASNASAQSSVGGSFNHLIATDASNAAHGQAGVAGELARLGMGDQASNVNQNAAQDAQHIAAMLNANKTSTLGNMKANATGAENTLKDLRAGAATYGTGLVGQAKTAGQQELANIATALQNQIGGLNSQKAGLRSSSGQAALNLAMQILSKQGSNAGPSAKDQALTAKTIAETQKILGLLPGSNIPGGDTKYGQAEQYLTQNGGSHAADLIHILQLAEGGGPNTKNTPTYKFDLTDHNMLDAVNRSLASRGYGAQDQSLLSKAIQIALGK